MFRLPKNDPRLNSPPYLVVLDNPRKQLPRNLRLQKTVPVVAERAGVPHAIVQPKPHKPGNSMLKFSCSIS